jgi:hypothetical protein
MPRAPLVLSAEEQARKDYEDRVYNVGKGAIASVWGLVILALGMCALLIASFVGYNHNVCQCFDLFDIKQDTDWLQGPSGPMYISIESPSAEACALSCCYRPMTMQGCEGWAYQDRKGAKPDPGVEGNCLLWVFFDGVTSKSNPGWVSARNGPPQKQCKVPKGQSWQVPVIPHNGSFYFDLLFALTVVVYAGGGMVMLTVLRNINASQNIFPNQAFWLEVAGLVKDGVSYTTQCRCLRGGATVAVARAAPSKTKADLSEPIIDSEDQSTRSHGASRGPPSAIHVAVSLGNHKSLLKLKDDPVIWALINTGDYR